MVPLKAKKKKRLKKKVRAFLKKVAPKIKKFALDVLVATISTLLVEAIIEFLKWLIFR